MVGVTSQGSNTRSQQRSESGRVSNQNRNRNAGNKIQGPMEKHTPRPRLQVWPSLKYTSVISFRCLADCRVESLIAESTRWPALVLQPTRQVSPTIIGKSIPDRLYL
ncbi:unnamed protein product [Staurois parvus]|uniref:Uncharacterized protein n=1 Tax=Staurois parvus TaxID=386267 RepID=A0ABN9CX45_9NEOB|nr:unnamed protein product [Staurois parvus]